MRRGGWGIRRLKQTLLTVVVVGEEAVAIRRTLIQCIALSMYGEAARGWADSALHDALNRQDDDE